ncbi:Aminotransferase, class I/classII [Penicillium digitatum]|uniref:Aminotransferase, class I/classII n=1 Tax=Penicillium digitatum TaxID=36651 RepID=A0A7T6XRZ3_PENDI|nr:Aminotransferase, class I/classII [Penicillium digitatum]
MASETITRNVATQSWFDQACFILPDAMFALTAQYITDSSPTKVNLGQGTYRDEQGNPWVLPSVRKSRKLPSQELNHEYLLIVGLAEFCKEAANMKKYYNPETKNLDIDCYCSALKLAEPQSVFIIHACAHNPTGGDPSKEQWQELARLFKARQLFPLFDAAFLGFNSGNVDSDAFAVRLLIEKMRLEAGVCLSFAKNMGLCGGTTYGAKIASTTLADATLWKAWHDDLIAMSSRIRSMRSELSDSLVSSGVPGSWEHLIRQSGMFGFLGLSPTVVRMRRENFHIYMAKFSRISIAGSTNKNVGYVGKSVTDCLKQECSSETTRELISTGGSEVLIICQLPVQYVKVGKSGPTSTVA